LEASAQVDLYHSVSEDAWKKGIFMREISPQVKEWNSRAKKLAHESRSEGIDQQEVNGISSQLNEWVAREAKEIMNAGKLMGLVGGDHAVPYSSIRLHAEKHPKMAVLHIDAHHDLRKAYEGFTHSHASIFYNVLEDTSLAQLVQVGIRDYCREEKD